MRIFLSYASEQQALAEQICLHLQQSGHSVFFDKESLQAGGDFRTTIRNELDRSEIFIFLISPTSVEPQSYTRSELEIARQKWPTPKGHVLPVMAVATDLDTVPPYLKAVSILMPEGEIVEAVSRAVDKWSPMEEVDVVQDTQRMLEERGTPRAVAGLIALGVAIGRFQEEVLERGSPGQTYRRRFKGLIQGQGRDAHFLPEMTEYIASAGREYRDDRGRKCREVTVSHRFDGKWVSSNSVYFLQRGKWIKEQHEPRPTLAR